MVISNGTSALFCSQGLTGLAGAAVRNENRINDETLRKLEYELDLLETQSSTAAAR